jgi:hypothetical protein
MAGLLIRWLEDTVESPPRRPGATPEERADDYLFGCHALAYGASITLLSLPSRLGQFSVMSSLPRPAQSAWHRLLTQHLPHLPLPARIMLYMAAAKMSEESEHVREPLLQALTRDLRPIFDSGNFILDIGGGLRRSFASAARILCTVNGADLPSLLRGPFCTAPRRLVLLIYQDLLHYVQQGQSKKHKLLLEVSLGNIHNTCRLQFVHIQ